MKRYIKSAQLNNSYTVYYIDRSSDRQMFRVYEASDREEAIKLAKADLGRDMYRLLRVEES